MSCLAEEGNVIFLLEVEEVGRAEGTRGGVDDREVRGVEIEERRFLMATKRGKLGEGEVAARGGAVKVEEKKEDFSLKVLSVEVT